MPSHSLRAIACQVTTKAPEINQYIRGDRLDDVLRLQCALFVSALNLQCCVMDREALL